MILKSYAKLNLYLEILNKREDGFHNLCTIFERINLVDTIVLSPRKDNLIKISCSHPDVPKDQSNLCYKSAKILQDKFKINCGVNIKIAKRIPVGAGLGGGSSNAAAVLLGLNKLWKIKASKNELAGIGSKLGSDVAFFIYEVPFALGSKRGDKIKLLKILNKRCLFHVITVPPIHVSTPRIYQEWDKGFSGQKRRLTTQNPGVRITQELLNKKDFYRKGILRNDLEPFTVKLYPEVGLIKEKLFSLGVSRVKMSGSGSSVFGVVSSMKEARLKRKQLQSMCNHWQVFAAKTV